MSNLREAAERALEALELAVRQNEHDMLLTGEELRQCSTAIASLRSALAQKEDGWLPIESAPKEIVVEYSDIQRYGAHVLLWANGHALRGRWWKTKDGASNFIADGAIAVHPTHWRPLPPPPSQGNDK